MNTKGTIEIRIMNNGFVLTDSRRELELMIKEKSELFKELNAMIEDEGKELDFGGNEDWLKDSRKEE